LTLNQIGGVNAFVVFYKQKAAKFRNLAAFNLLVA